MTYQPDFYASPIDLPEKRSGNMEIKHKWYQPGDEVFVVGWRQSILRGVPAIRADLKEPLKVHQLLEHSKVEGKDHTGMWMTDLPEELNQIGELLYTIQPYGTVLVGGLGLGILATAVAAWPGVEKIVVVEKSQDVINLVQSDDYLVVHDDIEHYLNTHIGGPFDFYLLDTWAGTGESTWWEDVMPLKRIIRNRFGMAPVVHGWAEDIMQGQILQSLTHTRPHWYYKYLPVPMSKRVAEYFVDHVGTPHWEKKYGKKVDKYIEEENKKARAWDLEHK